MRSRTQRIATLWLYGLLALLALAMPLLSVDFGPTWDEPYHIRYGQRVFDYLTSWGADQSYMLENSYLYGGGFDLFCTVANKMFPSVKLFTLRHICNSFFGWLTIVFSGLLALRLFSAWTALATVVFLVLSPRFLGHCMNNPKDIPFAAFFMMSLYVMSKIDEKPPFFCLKNWLALVASVGLAINIRAGGVLLIAYVGGVLLACIIMNRREMNVRSLGRLGLIWLLAASGMLLFGTLCWPWAQQNPFLRPFEALHELSRLGVQLQGEVLFNGVWQRIATAPRSYLPIWLYMTTPAPILLGVLASPLVCISAEKRHAAIALLFAGFFPLVYAVWIHAALYDGMRHFLFVYPILAILAAAAWTSAFEALGVFARKRWDSAWQYRSVICAFFLLAAALLWSPARFSVARYPYLAVYFNSFAGGIHGAFGQYEVDYWHNSLKEAIAKVRQYGHGLGKRVSFSTANGLEETPALYLDNDSDLEYIPRSSPRWDQANLIILLLRGDPESIRAIRAQMQQVDAVTVEGVPLSVILLQKQPL